MLATAKMRVYRFIVCLIVFEPPSRFKNALWQQFSVSWERPLSREMRSIFMVWTDVPSQFGYTHVADIRIFFELLQQFSRRDAIEV